MSQVWGCLIVLCAAPCLGAFIGLTRRHTVSEQRLYLAVELLLGASIVFLTRQFFPATSPWELMGLLALAMGRYWRRQETALLPVLGGLLCHDWQITLVVGLIGAVGLTFFRQVRGGTWEILTLITLALITRYGQDSSYVVAAIALSGTLAWLSYKTSYSGETWSFFQPEAKFLSLDRPLSAKQAGQAAVTLSTLKQKNYPILSGWLLAAGDDPSALFQFLEPSGDRPLMLRLTSDIPSQRFAIPIEQITSVEAFQSAIVNAFSREELGQQWLLIQVQPQAVWSGITYSRTPLGYRDPQAPLTEVVADFVTPLIVGDRTPLQYYGYPPQLQRYQNIKPSRVPPPDLLQQVAKLGERLEQEFASPQGFEWCFDGQDLHILWVYPLPELRQCWTRDYLSDLVPYPLQPLSASLCQTIAQQAIAQTLSMVVPQHTQGNPAKQILTGSLPPFITHYQGYSYYNRSLGDRFLQPLNIDWVTLPQIIQARLNNVLSRPRLFWRYLQWDWSWSESLTQAIERQITPTFKTIRFAHNHAEQPLSLAEQQQNIDQLQEVLGCLFGHLLRGQIILRTRRSLLRLSLSTLPVIPIPALEDLLRIAEDTEKLLPRAMTLESRAELFATLADHPEGSHIFQQLDQWLLSHGHQGDYPWELAQKRWQENPGYVRQRLLNLLQRTEQPTVPLPGGVSNWRQQSLQHIQQQLATVQDLLWQCLAELRYGYLAIATHLVQAHKLEQPSDIFALKLPEIRTLITQNTQITQPAATLSLLIQARQHGIAMHHPQGSHDVTRTLYGNPPDTGAIVDRVLCQQPKLQGQVASAVSGVGRANLYHYGPEPPVLGEQDILIVPYVHAILFPYLPKLKGLVTTKGGIFSQGACLARAQQLPMLVNIPTAMEQIQSGQWLRLDGHSGRLELLPDDYLLIPNG